MDKEKQKERGQWGSSFGFIMAAAGSAVGLGNLWKFPYVAGVNGGGAFVAIYLLIVVLVGFTIILGEMTIGRATQLNPIGAYKKLNEKWAIVGVMGVLSGFLVLSYYSVIGGWVLNYIFKYLSGGIKGNAEVYFGSLISGTTQPIFWHLLFMSITAIIVFKGISGGIEKFSKVMMPSLFVLLIIIAIRSVTLPGAAAGLEFYLKPDFSKLTPAALVAALGQVFFSLSLGMGCMVTYGSYLNKEENLEKDAFIVPFLDTLVALLAGFAVLPAVFAFNYEPGAGPGLIFITLPAIFAEMPFGAVFGLLFFVLVLFAAITSSISLLEVTVSYLIDRFNWSRSKSVIVLSSLMFLIGVPCSLSFGPMSNVLIFGKNFFDLLDYFTSNILLPLGGLLMCIFIGYVWKIDNAAKEITNDGKIPFKSRGLWTILVKIVAPISVLIVFLNAIGIIKF